MIQKKIINIKTEIQLSQNIIEAYNKLIDLISDVSDEFYSKKIEGTGGKISIADLIAYQIGWGKLLLNWYDSGIKEIEPDMPGDGFSSWDYIGLAQHFYKKYNYTNKEEQLAKFHEVVISIINIVEKENDLGNLDKVGVWNWCTLKSGKKWPLSKWITINTIAPYKRAQLLIKRFIKD